MEQEPTKIKNKKSTKVKENKNLQILYLTKIINNMIKRTEISQQKTPTVTKNKASYSNKGFAPLKNRRRNF
jgi:hypothetical protein